jgi:GWxTD domain-containing protein
MKKYFLLAFIVIFLAAPLLTEDKLAQEHKDWLELVSPIITKIEKEVFLKLKTKVERDKFIQLFWKKRDPLPDTQENEFYKEYRARIRFADMNFGHGAVKKGSQTERGYFYLLLGPPIERQMYATQSDLLPLELWHYKGEQEYGLPPFFYLIFYQPKGLGEYRLYSPGVQGPEELVAPTMASGALNRTQAYQVIKRISGELANASLSYLPGETTLGMSSLSSNTIIANVRSLPEKKFSDSYARNYLAYKDYVETEYSHNYIDSEFKVKVFDHAGHSFVHWTLEPSQVNFSLYKGKYYASFELILRVEDRSGNPILENEEEIPLAISPEDYKKHERQVFAFQDILPIIPGKFQLFFLMKNKTTNDFTSFQTEVLVPGGESEPFLSNLLLYQERESINENQKEKLKAFAFNGFQYSINTQNRVLPQKEIGIFCQIDNMNENDVKFFEVGVFSASSEQAVFTLKKPLDEVLNADGKGIDTGPLDISTLKPGYYSLEASVIDVAGKKVQSKKEHFILLSQAFEVVPWVYSKLHNSFPNPEHSYMLASQYFMTKQYDKARNLLRQNPRGRDDPKNRLLLAKTLYALQKFEDSLTVVFPVYQKTQEREAAKIISLNYVGLNDWGAALVYLEKLMQEAVELSVINLAAECYLKLDQPEKALPLLQKSLELSPDQPHIKKLEEEAKKRLNQ